MGTMPSMSSKIEGHGGDLDRRDAARARRSIASSRCRAATSSRSSTASTRGGCSIIDTRHEQAAAFAAEAHGKLARVPGVAALTAGPGVTNGMSAITSAHFNGSPMLVLGGRAPELRWGQGSLQEMDHLPLVRTITKLAETVFEHRRDRRANRCRARGGLAAAPRPGVPRLPDGHPLQPGRGRHPRAGALPVLTFADDEASVRRACLRRPSVR